MTDFFIKSCPKITSRKAIIIIRQCEKHWCSQSKVSIPLAHCTTEAQFIKCLKARTCETLTLDNKHTYIYKISINSKFRSNRSIRTVLISQTERAGPVTANNPKDCLKRTETLWEVDFITYCMDILFHFYSAATYAAHGQDVTTSEPQWKLNYDIHFYLYSFYALGQGSQTCGDFLLCLMWLPINLLTGKWTISNWTSTAVAKKLQRRVENLTGLTMVLQRCHSWPFFPRSHILQK